jgi:hypothetical protein
MTTRESIQWFKQTFLEKLTLATSNTPYSIDLLCAIAFQETGYIWSNMIGKLPLDQITQLAVGDTLDAPNRNAFPKNKQALLAAPNGNAMFDIARESLVNMAKYVKGYNGAVSNPNKFCHGFGIFQYDLQFFLTDPDYFLQKKWGDIDACFSHCITELNNAKTRQGWKTKMVLTDEEKVFVAIAYNRGSANLSKGFKQGHQSDDGRFYGENIFEYLRLSQSIEIVDNSTITTSNFAPLPPPTPILSDNRIYRVKITSSQLNLRSEPRVPRDNPGSNVKTSLPNGHLLSWLSGKISDKWWEVETSLHGAYFRGFVAQEFLEKVKGNTTPITVSAPATTNPTNGIMEVYMPRAAGSITKRTAPANALSLNEPGQPGRNVNDAPAELKQSLLSIIAWLNVEKPSHARYQPGNNSTFCNIYAHDYCYLAGVYFPRVWWTQSAIARLAMNQSVKPLYGNTIEEMRANNLFRWLRDFGEQFGWRQTGDLTKLQNAANIGGIGMIIARRKEEGRSGHVTIVAPENILGTAKRDANGIVMVPLQSQAGSRNFNFGRGNPNWWLGEQFAEHSFWIHA